MTVSESVQNNEVYKFLGLVYYRYSLISGVYFLNPYEVCAVHTIFLLTGYFIVRQFC